MPSVDDGPGVRDTVPQRGTVEGGGGVPCPPIFRGGRPVSDAQRGTGQQMNAQTAGSCSGWQRREPHTCARGRHVGRLTYGAIPRVHPVHEAGVHCHVRALAPSSLLLHQLQGPGRLVQEDVCRHWGPADLRAAGFQWSRAPGPGGGGGEGQFPSSRRARRAEDGRVRRQPPAAAGPPVEEGGFGIKRQAERTPSQ